MGFLDDLKRLLRREAADAKEWVDDSVSDANRTLDSAERRLHASPEERLQASLDDIATGEDSFEAIRAKADAATARPTAQAEVDEASGRAIVDAEVVDVRRDDGEGSAG